MTSVIELKNYNLHESSWKIHDCHMGLLLHCRGMPIGHGTSMNSNWMPLWDSYGTVNKKTHDVCIIGGG